MCVTGIASGVLGCKAIAVAIGILKRCWLGAGLLALVGCALLNNDATVFNRAPAGSDKLNLHYVTLGEGPPMVFVHGFGASSYTWNKITDALSRDHRLLLLDLKGHGASPKPKDDAYSIEDHARLVVDFIVAQDLRDATLVGHSLGGGVALAATLELLAAEPGRISRLILIDTVAYRQSFPLFIRVLRLPVIAGLLTCVIPPRFQVRHVLRRAYYDDDKITDRMVQAYAAPLSLPGGRHALVETARQIIPANIDDLVTRYADINISTLIIWGEHDEIVPLEIGKRLHETIARSQFSIIRDSGHIPHEEMPGETLSVIEKFLASPKSR